MSLRRHPGRPPSASGGSHLATQAGAVGEYIDSRYRAAADLLDGYVHESRFLYRDGSPDHHIIWASHGFEALFGCSVEQYNSRPLWAGFYSPEELTAAGQRAIRLRRGETVEAQVRMLRESGEVRWIHVRNQPVFDVLTQEVVGVLGVGQDITERKLAELQQERLERAILEVGDREQQIIAMNLHDGLGQELTGASLLLRSLADSMANGFPQGVPQVEELITLMNRAIHGVRTLAHGLSPTDLDRGDLPAALAALAARTEKSKLLGVRFDCRLRSDFTFAPDIGTHLYRIAHEAVLNVIRHSGATTLSISLSPIDIAGVSLQIADDGCGLVNGALTPAGMGLKIMQYRARMIGAKLFVKPRLRGGTSVTCRLLTLPSVARCA